MSDIQKKTSEKLKGILKQLTGVSQNTSLNQYSVPKQYAIRLLETLDKLATKRAESNWAKQIWSALKYYIRTRIIPVKSDKEVKEDLFEIFMELKPLFDQMDVAVDLKQSLTDKKINDKVKKLPQYRELAKLL